MFKFRHFNHFLFYNPKNVSIPPISDALIDYTWSTQVNSGNMELINSGTSGSTNDATIYSGEGVILDGTSYLDLTGVVTGDVSMIYMLDGVATYTETLFYNLNTGNTYKDLFYFSRSLTTTEQNQYSSDPNGFFDDVRDGAITDCVFNSPLDGTDEFVKDYQNYSETEKIVNGTFDTLDNWTLHGVTATTVTGNGFTGNAIRIVKDTGSYLNPTGLTGVIGKKYKVSLKYRADVSPSIAIGGGNNYFLPVNTGNAVYIEFITTATNNGDYYFVPDSSATYWEFDDVSVKELTGFDEITNYTTSVRDTTSALTYGTQEMKFLRDGNWRGAFSQYIELSIGHADTSWTPSGTWQIEEVDMVGTTETHRIYNSDGTKYTNGVSDGTYTVPTTEIILNNTNIENIAIDEYKIFRVYPTINDEATLYDTYYNITPAPVFSSNSTNSVPENQTSAITLQASNTTSYSISGTDSALFNVDANTGVVTFKTAPSYDNPSDANSDNVYEFTATATDSGGSTNQSVAITVTQQSQATTQTIQLDGTMTGEQ